MIYIYIYIYIYITYNPYTVHIQYHIISYQFKSYKCTHHILKTTCQPKITKIFLRCPHVSTMFPLKNHPNHLFCSIVFPFKPTTGSASSSSPLELASPPPSSPSSPSSSSSQAKRRLPRLVKQPGIRRGEGSHPRMNQR